MFEVASCWSCTYIRKIQIVPAKCRGMAAHSPQVCPWDPGILADIEPLNQFLHLSNNYNNRKDEWPELCIPNFGCVFCLLFLIVQHVRISIFTLAPPVQPCNVDELRSTVWGKPWHVTPFISHITHFLLQSSTQLFNTRNAT